LCGDQLDNDCDGTYDESVCNEQICPGIPTEYHKVSLLKFATQPYNYYKVAVAGRIESANVTCGNPFPPCQGDAKLVDKPSGEYIVLTESDMWKEIGCSGGSEWQLECSPMELNEVYMVWGQMVKTNGTYLLSVHGFCQ